MAAAIVAAVSGGCAEARQPADEATWRRTLLDERASNDAELKTSPTSPLSAIDRQALGSGEATYVHVDAGAVHLADKAGEGAALSFQPAGAGRWRWQPARSGIAGALREGNRPLAPGPVAAPAVFRLGRFSVLAQPVADSLVVMLHDSERDDVRRFHGLDYFAPDRRYLVTARIERWSDPARVTLPTTLRLEKSYRRRAKLRFEIDGKPHELTAFAPDGAAAGALFIPFRDATSGKSTYGGGRYIDLREPDGDTVEIDFNRAYNPMCNYSPAFNCPIPPAENRLRVAIAAGQKTHDH